LQSVLLKNLTINHLSKSKWIATELSCAIVYVDYGIISILFSRNSNWASI